MVNLKKEKINFHYTIIAGEQDQENIFYQIHDLGLGEYVTFINGLSHKETIDKISESDLFLLPSLGEGISNAVLEAMALGVPVISADCGGMGEVIKDSFNGFIFPVRNPTVLSELIKLFNGMDEKIINDIIMNAKNTIKENHLLQKQIEAFITLFNRIR